MNSLARKAVFWGWDAHHRFFVACAATLAAFLLLPTPLSLPIKAVICWDAFALSTLLLAWVAICITDPYEARRNAKLQDASRTFLFVIVISAATASLVAVGLLLGAAKNLSAARLHDHIALALTAIFLSWALIHTVFALRYAHYYYEDAPTKSRDQIEGGLVFPQEENPDYFDFAYFSFVIGMTAQVSDIQITSRRIRRIALLHGLISFVFNTAILAIFVNIVAGLL